MNSDDIKKYRAILTESLPGQDNRFDLATSVNKDRERLSEKEVDAAFHSLMEDTDKLWRATIDGWITPEAEKLVRDASHILQKAIRLINS